MSFFMCLACHNVAETYSGKGVYKILGCTRQGALSMNVEVLQNNQKRHPLLPEVAEVNVLTDTSQCFRDLGSQCAYRYKLFSNTKVDLIKAT